MDTLPAFFHPTTIISIDDDKLFLKTVSHMLSSENLIKTFDDPLNSLTFFESYDAPLKAFPFLSGCANHDYYDTLINSLVNCNLHFLHQLRNYHEKCKEISAIIVDFKMPGMDGIELCRQLKKFSFKKILLTGQADHKAAIMAFNENIIDRFICKDNPEWVRELNLHIKKLKQQFFQEYTNALISHLEADRQLPLSDTIFIDFFQEWCESNSIKEYFIIDKTGSMLVFNQKNECLIFVVHTEYTLNAFVKLNDDVSGIDTYIQSIRNREKIPFFGINKECWQFEPYFWKMYMHTPHKIEGREYYYCAVINCHEYDELYN